MVSGTCALLMKAVIEAEGRSRAAAPKGSMTHSFTRMGNFILLLLDSPVGLRPSSCDLSLQAAIWALRLEFGHKVGIWALRLGFGPRGWDLGFETWIWASRLELGP